MRLAMRNVFSGGGDLPYKKRIEWIYGMKGPYIDTGIAPLLWTDSIYIDATIEAGNWLGTDMFFGADTSSSAVACSPAQDGTYFKAFSTGSAPRFVLANHGENRIELKYENKKVAVMQNGVAALISNGESPDARTSNPLANSLWIFKRHNTSGSLSQRANKLHRCRIARDGVDILDLVPVIDFDDVTCMFDQVTRQFFYNRGTGSFVAGPDWQGGGV